MVLSDIKYGKNVKQWSCSGQWNISEKENISYADAYRPLNESDGWNK